MQNVTNPARLADGLNFPGLVEAIEKAGLAIEQSFTKVGSAWTTNNAVAVQTIIDSFNPLPSLKVQLRQAMRDDALVRIQALYPAIVSVDFADLIFDLWGSIAPAARAPVADFQKLLAIRLALKNAVASINAATTLAEARAVVPSWP